MLLPSVIIDYKKVFELVLAGDNTKNSVNTDKIQKYSIFLKTSAEDFEGNIIFLRFLKIK